MLTHVEIAANLLFSLHPHHTPPSHHRIQALCILAQRHHLKLYNTPLFGDAIVAYQDGPIIPNLLERAMAMFGERDTLTRAQTMPYLVLYQQHNTVRMQIPPTPASTDPHYITLAQIYHHSIGVPDEVLWQGLIHATSAWRHTPHGRVIPHRTLSESVLVPHTNTSHA